MVNIVTTCNGHAREEAKRYIQVQRFWNESFGRPEASATIGGVAVTRFTASRLLNLNSAPVARYLDGLGKKKANALRREALLEEPKVQ